MRAVFPGRVQSSLQAFDVGLRGDRRIVTYISNNALIVLGGPNELIQTVSVDGEQDLQAVAINEFSGKIAICTKSTVHIYQTFEHDFGLLKWTLQHSFEPSCGDQQLRSLSWGPPDELLAAGSALTLFNAEDTGSEVWTRPLACPAKLSLFSPDANLIASTGQHDRMVKIWRRQFFGENRERFDISYLAHPTTVSHFRWRGRPHREQHVDAVLYTTCSDNKLRVWAAMSSHDVQILQLWTVIDLVSAIINQGDMLSSSTITRHAFVVDNWDFRRAVESSEGEVSAEKDGSDAGEHLKTDLTHGPEVCMISDGNGCISAWALARIGSKTKQETDVQHIARIAESGLGRHGSYADGTSETLCNSGEKLQKHYGGSPIAQSQDYVICRGFSDPRNSGCVTVLFHRFSGHIEWFECNIDLLLTPTDTEDCFALAAIWTGHSKPIEKIYTSPKALQIATTTFDREVSFWSQTGVTGVNLRPHSTISTKEALRSLMLFDEVSQVAMNHEKHILIKPTASVTTPHHSAHPEHGVGSSTLIIVPKDPVVDTEHPTNFEYSIFIVPADESLDDSAASTSCLSERHLKPQILSSTIEVDKQMHFQVLRPRDVPSSSAIAAVSVMSDGTISIWPMPQTRSNHHLNWKPSASFRTNIKRPALLAANEIGDVAVVDHSATCLSIWNVTTKCLLWLCQFKSHETITCLAWHITPWRHSLLAVTFSARVRIYGQRHLQSGIGDMSWTLLKESSIGHLTNLPIADTAWLQYEDILLATGNQLLQIETEEVPPKEFKACLGLTEHDQEPIALSEITNAFNALLPDYAPVALHHSINAGKFSDCQRILLALNGRLKFYTTGDYFPSCLNKNRFDLESQDLNGTESNALAENDDEELFSEDLSVTLKARLNALRIPFLKSDQEHALLACMIDSIGFYQKQERSVDSLAIKYLINLRYSSLRAGDGFDPLATLPWRDIVFAYFSTADDVLVDLTTRHYKSKLLWEDARQCGMFMWLTDETTLKTQFEAIARNEYTKTDEKNPIDCSLYYLALKKKSILVGLWRMASWNKEQRTTQKFLSNNFDDPRWKTAALKNAYALLGRRRFEYAASFFLLAGQLKDAVNVLANQHGDLQLAMAVARVYEGDGGPVLKSLLEERLLPRALREGNRWLALWTFWKLGKRSLALRSLVEPLDQVIETIEPMPIRAKHWSNDDPALVHMYRHVRDATAEDPRQDDISLEPVLEWKLITRSAFLYSRMGMPWMGLDLVRNWRFTKAKSRAGGVADKVVSNGAQAAEHAEDKDDKTDMAKRLPHNQKKVTAEPSAASILDSFDF